MERKIAVVDGDIIDEIYRNQQEILRLLKKEKHGESELIKVNEAAKILNLSEQKVRQMINEDKLPYIRLGRSIRLKKNELFKTA
jgi:excisionase family DNA binding protein